jgi:hypothetical protein
MTACSVCGGVGQGERHGIERITIARHHRYAKVSCETCLFRLNSPVFFKKVWFLAELGTISA